MREPDMQSTEENGTASIPWCSETNWIIAHGSLEASIAVDYSDYPISEPDPDTASRKSPLILKPPLPDSDPCEIKICFQQKNDISQIYVRSTARVYEVYYARSPNSSNEYLCTVRCGVAERDETLLQTNWIEDVADGHGECVVGELTDETGTDGSSAVTSEDDWVNIKIPKVEQSTVSEQMYTNDLKNVQDLYEATAQISDADPCSLLTIRLLSLQDKGQLYLDEVYVFVDPVESTDSGNESLLPGSSTQSSLMAMFIPTLLQLSKSGGGCSVQDKHASNEVLNGENTEMGSRRIDETDVRLETNQVPHQNVKPTELDKDTTDPAELPQHTLAEKCVEPIKMNDLHLGHLETALEQLISRVSKVENLFLRFEEKMLKPIERIDARLQKVEDQLEKLAKNSQYIGSPHCTRFSAPAFSCSESNSSSFHNEQSNYPPCGTSEPEKKDISSNNMPGFSHDANFHPGLVVSAPEFSCEEEDEEGYDDLKPTKDPHCVEPKKTLSVDDALAAAFNGFLSSAIVLPSEPNQTTSSLLSGEVREPNQYQEHADPTQIEAQELLAAENANRDLPRYAQVLTIKAPDFIEEENGDVEHLNYTQCTSDTPCLDKNNEKDPGDKVVAPCIESKSLFTSSDSSQFDENESTSEFGPAALVKLSNTHLVNEHLNESFEVNTIESYFGGDTVDTSNDETSPGKTTDDEEIASKHVLGHRANVTEVLEGYVLDSCGGSSPLDFEFPILEVKFASDVYTRVKCPIEALLDGVAESKTETLPIHDDGDDGDDEQVEAFDMDGNEKTDCLPVNHLLVDVEVSATDGSSNSDDGSQNLSTQSSQEMNVSLI